MIQQTPNNLMFLGKSKKVCVVACLKQITENKENYKKMNAWGGNARIMHQLHLKGSKRYRSLFLKRS